MREAVDNRQRAEGGRQEAPVARLCVIALVGGLVGCATTTVAYRTPAAAWIGVETTGLRVMVVGDFLDRAPDDQSARQSLISRLLFGPTTSPPRRLRTPQGMGTRGGSLLICDQGIPDVLEVDPTTGRVRSRTRIEHRPACPVDACEDDAGNLMVADAAGRTVRVYDGTGRLRQEITPPGEATAAFRPTSVVVREGVLFVADAGNRGVQRYDLSRAEWIDPWPAGPHVARWGAPTGLAFARDGTLLVTDIVQSVVHRVAADGTPLAPLGRPGRQFGELVRPKDVAVTPGGWILVTDAARQAVVIFDDQGACVAELAGRSGWSGWTLPHGVIALSPEAEAALQKDVSPTGTEHKSSPTGYRSAVVVSDTLGTPSLTLLWIESFSISENHDERTP